MKSLKMLNDLYKNKDIYSYEKQNGEYEGLVFIDRDTQKRIRSRLAKKTPKKAGYFVAFWEKHSRVNMPFTHLDRSDLLIIIIYDHLKSGYFLFPKKVLIDHGILSSENKPGKMALRIYPTWCTELNQSAANTQKWQTNYFTDTSEWIKDPSI